MDDVKSFFYSSYDKDDDGKDDDEDDEEEDASMMMMMMIVVVVIFQQKVGLHKSLFHKFEEKNLFSMLWNFLIRVHFHVRFLRYCHVWKNALTITYVYATSQFFLLTQSLKHPSTINF